MYYYRATSFVVHGSGSSLLLSQHREALPGFDAGGMWWFTDLTAPDTMCVFPLITGSCHLLNIQVRNTSRAYIASPEMVVILACIDDAQLTGLNRLEASRRQQLLENAFKGLSLAMVFVAANVPAVCVCVLESRTLACLVVLKRAYLINAVVPLFVGPSRP